ncbi:MAG: FtsL-like putative cell division protein [Bacteroidetes bacterium]|nr:FtsL-like putative cell division protein [Bacteroidota bacterium]
MGKNIIKEQEVKKEKSKKKFRFKLNIPKPKETSFGNAINEVLDGTFLTRKSVIKLLPLGLFIAFLAAIYIANNYWSIKSFREMQKLKRELKELRFEHISSKSELMYISKQSEVARRLDSLGIKESTVPPQKFFYKSN